MKKLYFTLLIFILSMNCVFSFEIKDTSNTLREYYSVNNPQLIVKTSENMSNFTVKYNLSSEITKELLFVTCESNSSCLQFSLLSLISEQNVPVPDMTDFLVIVNNENKIVYLDSKTPEVSFSNYTLNTESKKVTLNFNFSDNSGKILSANLYEEVNGISNLISDVKSVSTYDLSISAIGNKVFILKVIDIAGNSKEVKQVVSIPDIFLPQIINNMIMKKDDKLTINFKISDENLMKYEIAQENLTLSEYVSGTSIEKTINLPYTSGDIIFRVYDQNSNIASLSLNLDSKITVNQNSKYSNKKFFEITSNADNCTLSKFDSKDVNTNFDKSSDKFSVAVSANEVKNYNLEYYCVKNNFKEYFKSEFYFDDIAPTQPVLNITKGNGGELELEWTGGIDNQSAVVFNVFRDSKRIYSGTKTNYVDKDLEYPNTYKYYIESFDEAKNSVKSDSISEVPKKVKINLDINLQKEQILNDSNFTLKFTTDENTNITVFIKNGNMILFEKNLLNFSQKEFSQNLLLLEGINEIQLTIIDEFSNSFKQTYFVTYQISLPSKNGLVDEQIISEKNSSVYKVTIAENLTDILVPQNAQNLAQNLVSNISSVFVSEDNRVKDESIISFTKVGLFLIFIIFAVLTWYYLFHEDKLRQKIKDLRYLKESKTRDLFRNKDSTLSSSLENIKKEREQKQHVKILEEKKKKNEVVKDISEYEKQKIADLNKSDKISDRMMLAEKRTIIEDKPNLKKQDVEEKSKKEEPEFIDETELMQRNEKKQVKKNNSFFDWFRTEEQKNDPLLKYISNQKSKKSYESKSDFIAKEEPVIKVESVKVEKKEDLSLDKDRLSNEQIRKLNENKVISDERNKQIFSSEKKEEKPIDKKHMLDGYLSKIIPKRRSYFSEKEVNKDIFERNK